MKGFDNKFKDLPDYILKITYEIWENNDVEAIIPIVKGRICKPESVGE